MKKSKFLLITAIAMVALIIFLISYIVILGDNMDVAQIMIGASLTSFGLGVSLIANIICHITIEE